MQFCMLDNNILQYTTNLRNGSHVHISIIIDYLS
jgi:hypothetical protein